MGGAGRFDMGDRILLLAPGVVVEVQDPAHPVRHEITDCIPWESVATSSAVRSSSRALWNLAIDPAGGKSLHRWSIEDGCTTVTSPAQYDVTSFTVGDDDVAQCQAFRMSDGRTVLASVTAAGAVTVLDESAAPGVIAHPMTFGRLGPARASCSARLPRRC
jgi:hypothetical protein